MIASMTGYGVAEGKLDKNPVKVEIRTLNSRYFDFSARLPFTIIPLENDIKKLLQTKIKRGKVNLSVVINNSSSLPPSMALDESKVLFYVKSLRRFAKKHGIKGDITVQDLLAVPDLFVCEQKKLTQSALKRYLMPIISRALKSLVAMREREGCHITSDMRKRVAAIECAVGQMEKLSQNEPQFQRDKLRERIGELADDSKLNAERLEEEVAYLADKCDITEELVRLRSHIKAILTCLKAGGEVGKRLEFIAQEMNRETNTVGSKSQNVDISKLSITIKLEIEKLREQVQNLE